MLDEKHDMKPLPDNSYMHKVTYLFRMSQYSKEAGTPIGLIKQILKLSVKINSKLGICTEL